MCARALGDLFAAPLIGGLNFKQRRTVIEVRHGTPSSDPTLAAVERLTAERIVKYYRRLLAFFVVASVPSTIMAVDGVPVLESPASATLRSVKCRNSLGCYEMHSHVM